MFKSYKYLGGTYCDKDLEDFGLIGEKHVIRALEDHNTCNVASPNGHAMPSLLDKR